MPLPRAETFLIPRVQLLPDMELSALAQAMLATTGAANAVNDTDSDMHDDFVMLKECNKDACRSAVDRDTANTWLRDCLLYFCQKYGVFVQMGFDSLDAR